MLRVAVDHYAAKGRGARPDGDTARAGLVRCALLTRRWVCHSRPWTMHEGESMGMKEKGLVV